MRMIESDDRDDNDHDDHFWVAEALARNHECGGNVALASTERHDPFRVGVRSAEQPTNPKAQCDKRRAREDSSSVPKTCRTLSMFAAVINNISRMRLTLENQSSTGFTRRAKSS